MFYFILVIFDQNNDTDVIYGETTNLTCPIVFVNPQTYNISWYFNDTCLSTMNFMNFLSTRNYQIISADFSNDGQYRCQVDNGKQSKTSDGFFVRVKGGRKNRNKQRFWKTNQIRKSDQ